MSNEEYIVQGYLPSIGIECHVQLKSKTKLFAGVSNDARDAEPNTLISHICLGMPGALPVLNEKAVELGSRAAFALKTSPQTFSKFDRKHYFYPDLPKGYQITQFDQPIIIGGHVDIEVDGQAKRIGITRAHLEEDAGKSSHPSGKDYSLVDLNRAGTPLLEIVSEPDMHSAQEAKAYAKELYLLMRYADVSEANLFHGNMRFDVNVSVSKDHSSFGTRTETKNLNSFRSVEKAVEFEVRRQIELLEKGQEIVQETRGWDDAKQKTFSQRTKEEAHDYRYFPEPDLPPILISEDFISEVKATMPLMPAILRKKLRDLDVDESTVETLVDEMPAGQFMQEVLKESSKLTAKRIANWLASDVQGLVANGTVSWESVKFSLDDFLALDRLVSENQISSTNAKIVLAALVEGATDTMTIARERDLLQVSDEGALDTIVAKVLSDNPKPVEDLKNGEEKILGFLVGQVMKESGGKANPALAREIIKRKLSL